MDEINFQRFVRRQRNAGVQDVSSAERQPMRGVREKRTVRAHRVQSAESACDGVRPAAHSRRDGVRRGRSGRRERHGAVRAFAKGRVAHTGPQEVVGRRRVGVQGQRSASVGLQDVSDHQAKGPTEKLASHEIIRRRSSRRHR